MKRKVKRFDKFDKDNFRNLNDFSKFTLNNIRDFSNENKPNVNSLFIDLLAFVSKRRNSMDYSDYSIALSVVHNWREKLGFSNELMENIYGELCKRSTGR